MSNYVDKMEFHNLLKDYKIFDNMLKDNNTESPRSFIIFIADLVFNYGYTFLAAGILYEELYGGERKETSIA